MIKGSKGSISIIAALIGFVIAAGVMTAGYFTSQRNVGVSIPTPVAFFETSLQESITSSDTTMTLVSFETADGTDLATGTIYGFVIDEGASNEEVVIGTASSSNQIVNMSRGVSAVTGRTEISALKEAHRRGASVKITDAPVVITLARILNGDDTIPNLLSYEATTTPSSDTNLVHKYYVDSQTAAGAPVADESTAGIGIFSTLGELQAGTATNTYSGVTYNLFPQNKYFNATPSATTTVPVTGVNGKLSQGFLDLTQAFTFSGGLTSTESTSLASTTINDTLAVTGTSTFGNATFASTSITGTTTMQNVVVNGTSDFVQWKFLSSTTTSSGTAPAGTKAVIVSATGRSSNCSIGGFGEVMLVGSKTTGTFRTPCATSGYWQFSASFNFSTMAFSVTHSADVTPVLDTAQTIYFYK